MSIILEQIEKAERKARQLHTDVAQLATDAKWQNPAQMASDEAKRDRHEFLRESLGDLRDGLKTVRQL